MKSNNPYFMYNDRALSYAEATKELDMSALYERFLPLIPSQGTILDAGAGAGRDSLEFLNRGYQVVTMEPSSALATIAAQHTGHDVLNLSFQHMQMVEQFDGIWASASLLHVPPTELPEVFTRFEYALKPAGVVYYSFKYGSGVHMKNDLQYSHLSIGDIDLYIRNFKHVDQWITEDVRPDHSGEQWMNGILRKT